MSKVRATPVAGAKPRALVVFLENVGYVAGRRPPPWLMYAVDFLTEEYAKALLRLYGAHRRYARVVILEDANAVGDVLVATLLEVSRTHMVDLLLLVHGDRGQLLGHRGDHRIGGETFAPLLAAVEADPSCLDLRMVYGLNCYGASLAPTWLALGATVANGSLGINWFPEPSLSVFLRRWLRGDAYSLAVRRSNEVANRWWTPLLRARAGQHPWLESSRQVVFGRADITIDDA
jgi:hypothetical protein